MSIYVFENKLLIYCVVLNCCLAGIGIVWLPLLICSTKWTALDISDTVDSTGGFRFAEVAIIDMPSCSVF